MISILPARAWQEGREKNGPIVRGQRWAMVGKPMVVLTVMKKVEGSRWRVAFMEHRGANSSHKFDSKQIWKYYDKLS